MADPIGRFDLKTDGGDWVEVPVFDEADVESPLEVWTGNEWARIAITDGDDDTATTPLEMYDGTDWHRVTSAVSMWYEIEEFEDGYDHWRYDSDHTYYLDEPAFRGTDSEIEEGEVQTTTRASYENLYGLRIRGADFVGTMQSDFVHDNFPRPGDTFQVYFRLREREDAYPDPYEPDDTDENITFEMPIVVNDMFDDGDSSNNKLSDFNECFNVVLQPEVFGGTLTLFEHFGGNRSELDSDVVTGNNNEWNYDEWHRLEVYLSTHSATTANNIFARLQSFDESTNFWSTEAEVQISESERPRWYNEGGFGFIGDEHLDVHVDHIGISDSVWREDPNEPAP